MTGTPVCLALLKASAASALRVSREALLALSPPIASKPFLTEAEVAFCKSRLANRAVAGVCSVPSSVNVPVPSLEKREASSTSRLPLTAMEPYWALTPLMAALTPESTVSFLIVFVLLPVL